MAKLVNLDYEKIGEIAEHNYSFNAPHNIRHIIGFDTEYNEQNTLSFQFFHWSLKRTVIYVDEKTSIPESGLQHITFVRIKDMSDRMTFKYISEDVLTIFEVKPGENVAFFAHSAANDYMRFNDFYDLDYWDGAIRTFKKKLVGKVEVNSSQIFIFDTSYFFPVSLAQVAKNTKTGSKVEMAEKSKMDEVMKESPELFFLYGEHDAKIVAEIGNEILRAMFLTEHVFRERAFSLTPSAMLAYVFSKEDVADTEDISYKGGHTESFYYGSYDDRVYDYDMIGAYNTIIASMPVWKEDPISFEDPRELFNFMSSNNLAGGEVELIFKFKENVPCTFPYAIRNGQAYPREGRTRVSPQEFFVAFTYLETVQIVNARIYVPTGEVSQRAEVMRAMMVMRSLVKSKNKVLADALKIIANAAYGAQLQGLGSKTYPDLVPSTEKEGELVKVTYPMPKSRASNRLMGSFTTAMARAVLMEYIYHFANNSTRLFLVATDGFLVDKPLERSDMFGVGVYGKLLSKVRTDYISQDREDPRPEPILEGNEYYDIFVFQARRYIVDSKIRFSGASGISIKFLRDAIARAMDRSKVMIRQKRMVSPIDKYNRKVDERGRKGRTGKQDKVLYEEVERTFSVLPPLGTKYWVSLDYRRRKEDVKDIIKFRATAKPIETSKEVLDLEKYKRKREGKALDSMGPTMSFNRIEARNFMFGLRLTTVEVARLMLFFYPSVKRKDLVEFFSIDRGSLRIPFEPEGRVMPQANEFISSLIYVLDCFIDVKWESPEYARSVQRLKQLCGLDGN